MPKKTLQILTVVAILAAGLVYTAMRAQTQPKSEFKNVQVNTDMTKEELQDYMGLIVDELGVEKCTYCHVRDKSSDENEHKVEAREYMRLVKELNDGFFKDMEPKDKITCYTCHRGDKVPFNSIEDEEEAEAKK